MSVAQFLGDMGMCMFLVLIVFMFAQSLQHSDCATPVSFNVATVKFLTVTPKAVSASHLEQTGGDMKVYNSSASAAFASIDMTSPQVIKAFLTFANQFRNSTT